jgi:hypothetical protein
MKRKKTIKPLSIKQRKTINRWLLQARLFAAQEKAKVERLTQKSK